METAAWPEQPGIHFDEFTLEPDRRRLLRAGQAVHLGSRAFELLELLIEQAGVFVGTEQLLQRLWPRGVVADGTLRVHVAALRKALDDGVAGRRYVLNAHGRGYCFVGSLRAGREAAPAPVLHDARLAPDSANHAFGREECISRVKEKLRRTRLVTLVGYPGVGKSVIAGAVARGFFEKRADGADHAMVATVDLAELAGPASVAPAVLSILECRAEVTDAVDAADADLPCERIVRALENRRCLLVLDNCEHVIGGVAELVERILARTAHVHLLVTSREPLRAQAEWQQHVGALPVPPDLLPTEEATRGVCASFDLFADLIARSRGSDVLYRGEVEAIGQICRLVDGNPLGLELAATRAAVVGILPVASALRLGLQVLKGGRRLAAARHRSMGAALDWSFDLLPAAEKELLVRLSVFSSAFSVSSALAVGRTQGRRDAETLELVFELVEKSLLSAGDDDAETVFCMLNLTRAYARERLNRDEQLAEVRRRHAQDCLECLRRGAQGDPVLPPDKRSLALAGKMADLREALAWAADEGAEPALGTELLAHAKQALEAVGLGHEMAQILGCAGLGDGGRSGESRVVAIPAPQATARPPARRGQALSSQPPQPPTELLAG